MRRPIKIAVITGVVAAALVAGWVLTRPADEQSLTASSGTVDVAPSVLLTAPTAATVANVIPADVTWQLSNLVAVPVSPTAGPTRTSPEGIRFGFSHNPSGALMAAANWSAAYAQIITAPATGTALVDERMMPWPGQAEAHRRVAQAASNPGPSGTVFQVAGFRFLAYDGDHATLLIAKQVTAAHVGYADYITLVWSSGDWMVVPAVDGHGELGSPCTFPLLPEWTKFAGVA